MAGCWGGGHDLVIISIYKAILQFDGNCACLHGVVGKLGTESKNRTKCQGVIVRHIKGEEVERMHLDFRVNNEPEVSVKLFNLLY